MADTTTPSTTLFESSVQELYTAHVSKTKEAIDKAAQRRIHTLDDMTVYLKRAGLFQAAATDLRIIHIAGTKGKGSTVSMCESITRRAYGMTPTLMFTSPHLVDIRERIRVNGQIISKEIFGEAYWNLRRKLEAYDEEDADTPTLPGYFRMLTLMVFYLTVHYRNESGRSIATLLLEVGMGGRYDATNSYMQLLSPLQSFRIGKGVTLIDYDHVRVLGNTLEAIAWEKGGIYRGPIQNGGPRAALLEMAPHPERKKDEFETRLENLNNDVGLDLQSIVYALGTNTKGVCNVLRLCAATEGPHAIEFVGGGEEEGEDPFKTIPIGLPGEHQRTNAKLAHAVCQSLVRESPPFVSTSWSAVAEALKQATWPGRCQTISWETAPHCTFRIDGAHTSESIKVGLEWYLGMGTGMRNCIRVLVFYCGHERNPVDLFRLLLDARFDRIFMCPPASSRPSGEAYPTIEDLLRDTEFSIPSNPKSSGSWHETLADIWNAMTQSIEAKAVVASSVRHVLDTLGLDSSVPQPVQTEVFVTGSLYLAGSVLEELDWAESQATGSLDISALAA